MYLSRLIVQNYRSIKLLDLKFSKGKNIIVGKNNAGKSNIIKAIDLVLGESAPAYEKSENITENDFYKGDITQSIIIYCELIRNIDEELNFDEINKCYGLKINAKWVEGAKGQKQQYKYKLADETDNLLGNINSLLNIDENGEKIVNEYVDSKLRNQLDFSSEFSNKYHFSFAFRAKYNDGKIEKQLRSFFCESPEKGWNMAFSAPVRNELLQSVIIPSFRDPQNQLRISSWGWYGKLLKNSVDTSNEKLQNAFKGVRDASDEVFEKLKEKINDSKVKVAFPNTEISFQFNPDTKQDIHKSALIYVDDGFRSQLQDKGSGIQSAIIIGLFHFYTREILHAPSSLLAIEEPELYLHPHGRRVVSSRLDDFLENGKNQVIVTTHSSEFVNSTQDNLNIIVVTKNIDDGTLASNVNFDTPEEKQLLIKNQNTEMFFADLVILVEGNGDKYILEEVAKKYGEQNDTLGKNWLNDKNISVIATGGKDDFWKYTVKLKALKIEYRVLSDFDFFKSGLGNYLLKNNLVSIKDRHNELNSKISGINKNCECLEELNGDKSLQKSVEEFIDELYTYGLFVHKCGELEDTYTDESKEYLTKNSLGGNKKEQAALALVILIVSKQKEVADLIKIEFYKPLFDEITSYLTSQQSVIEKKSQSEESVLTTPSETNDSSQKIPF